MNKIDEDLLKEYMDKFYGYGNINGKYWFIGMEEGGGSSIEEINSRIEFWRKKNKPILLDNYEFHIGIKDEKGNSFAHFFEGTKIKYQQTWGGLIKLLLACKVNKMPCLDEVKSFQSGKWGRTDSDNCIAEIFPLPSPKTRTFNYSQWTKIEFLKSRKRYKNELKKIRIDKLKELLKCSQPLLVVFYSSNLEYLEYWSEISGVNFKEVKGVDICEIKGRWLKAKFATRNKIHYAVINHPTSKGMNNHYFQKVGKKIKEMLSDHAYGAECFNPQESDFRQVN